MRRKPFSTQAAEGAVCPQSFSTQAAEGAVYPLDCARKQKSGGSVRAPAPRAHARARAHASSPILSVPPSFSSMLQPLKQSIHGINNRECTPRCHPRTPKLNVGQDGRYVVHERRRAHMQDPGLNFELQGERGQQGNSERWGTGGTQRQLRQAIICIPDYFSHLWTPEAEVLPLPVCISDMV